MAAPIRIGAFAPFSGPLALRRNGPQMTGGAAAQVGVFNGEGGSSGRPVELLIRDNAYDTDRTVTVVRELLDAGVVAFLNSNGTPQIDAILPELEERGIPCLLPFGGSAEWFSPPRSGLLGLNAPFADVGWLLGRWTAADGHRRVVVFHPDRPTVSVTMAEIACRGFEAAAGHAGTATKVCVPLGCSDGPAMADALQKEKPDAIIVLTNWPELIAAAEALQRRGTIPPLYSWSANVTQEVAEAAGDLLQGMNGYASTLVGPLDDAPALQTYRATFGRLHPDLPPDFLSLHAFAQAMVFTEALSRVEGAVTGRSLVEAFYTLDHFETGILPPVGFDRARHLGIGQIQPMRLVHGRWTPIGPPEDLPALGGLGLPQR
jgi:ABC-type branched-subunit amino acid transport system substrate-binding protein